MISWDTFKAAAAEYSRYRPLLVAETWEPTPGLVFHPLPTNVIGIESIDFGTYAPAGEVWSAGAGATALWNDDTGQVMLNPAPEIGTVFLVVWRKLHQPVETVVDGVTSGTFPTIPSTDLMYVEMIEKANFLEDKAVSIESGPVIYQVGQTVVNRATAANGLRTQARQLRMRVEGALVDTVGISA